MTAVQALIGQDMSLNKSLKYCGMFKRQWYWKPKARKPKANASSWKCTQNPLHRG